MVRLWIGFSVRVTRVRLSRFSSLGPVLRVFIRRISPVKISLSSSFVSENLDKDDTANDLLFGLRIRLG
ncbi:hypothetical protein Hanom_Chr00s000003g01603661 [Helianthus anomalus]